MLYISVTKSRFFALSTCVLFILLMHLVNEAQFLNITSLFFSSDCLAANNCASVLVKSGFGSSPTSPAIVIVPLTSMYASL